MNPHLYFAIQIRDILRKEFGTSTETLPSVICAPSSQLTTIEILVQTNSGLGVRNANPNWEIRTGIARVQLHHQRKAGVFDFLMPGQGSMAPPLSHTALEIPHEDRKYRQWASEALEKFNDPELVKKIRGNPPNQASLEPNTWVALRTPAHLKGAAPPEATKETGGGKEKGLIWDNVSPSPSKKDKSVYLAVIPLTSPLVFLKVYPVKSLKQPQWQWCIAHSTTVHQPDLKNYTVLSEAKAQATKHALNKGWLKQVPCSYPLWVPKTNFHKYDQDEGVAAYISKSRPLANFHEGCIVTADPQGFLVPHEDLPGRLPVGIVCKPKSQPLKGTVRVLLGGDAELGFTTTAVSLRKLRQDPEGHLWAITTLQGDTAVCTPFGRFHALPPPEGSDNGPTGTIDALMAPSAGGSDWEVLLDGVPMRPRVLQGRYKVPVHLLPPQNEIEALSIIFKYLLPGLKT